MTITSVSESVGLRERFIEDAKMVYKNRNLDFSQSSHPGQEGRFCDKKVHRMWLGYELIHTAGHWRDKEDAPSSIFGHYIVGNHTGPGLKLVTGYRPFVHRNKRLACMEADRLAKEHGNSFVVFRCIKTFSPDQGTKDE